MNSTGGRILLIIVVFALLIGISDATAGISVYPTYLFLQSPTRAASIIITNNSNNATEIWIDFRYGYPASDDSGNVFIQYLDSADVAEPSALGWIRVFPQRIILESQESQKVRVLVSPPAGLPSREYWARIVIHSQDRESISPVTTQQQRQLRSAMKLMTNIDIPFHYRVGQVFSGVVLQGVNAEVRSGVLRLINDITRSGNASFWGTYKAVLRDQKGKAVATKEKNVIVYHTLQYLFTVDVTKVPQGTYTLEIEITPHRRDIKREFLLASQPVRQNINVTIP
jgi:hypothetical protein